MKGKNDGIKNEIEIVSLMNGKKIKYLSEMYRILV